MPEFGFLDGQPFWLVYFTLLGVVLCRAQATYWIGRGLGAGVYRSRMGARLGARLDAARQRIDRYGAPVVTLSFCTVGVQTAVNLAAGAMRMRFPRYLAAMFVGSLVWAGMWGVVIGGLAGTWWSMFLHSPWMALGTGTLALAAVVLLVLRSRRSGAAGPVGDGSPADGGSVPEGEEDAGDTSGGAAGPRWRRAPTNHC
ncbi:membrane protein DedA with SNARE-associated domain [Nocardiopsis arvandica]|uniref:Membrane protein DedA with SNARE-associated domain n=1 Tax=Nocardiopsis sinuspersici TaxID=501010 RepID=A0A7Z0BJY6_9ACTN|nr:VTT domain-containing protein [Nocardiopsis sinuspersici]NYH53611.1 membrane protein DedA with SNARE-associated domain [Nocardiopsis sinuspersici]